MNLSPHGGGVLVSSDGGLLRAGHWLLLLAGGHSPASAFSNQPWNKKFMILVLCAHWESSRVVRKVVSKEWEISST